MSDTFYFVVMVDKGQALTVIDLAYCVDYERDDWSSVDNENFTDPSSAINHARRLANRNGLAYRPFESRYDSYLNEPKLQYY